MWSKFKTLSGIVVGSVLLLIAVIACTVTPRRIRRWVLDKIRPIIW